MQIFKFLTAFVFSVFVVATSLKTDVGHKRYEFKISTPDRSGQRLKGDMGTWRERRHTALTMRARGQRRPIMGQQKRNDIDAYHGRF